MWIFGGHRHLAEEKLSDYVSGRLSPYQKGRLERSLDECVTCRQELESLQITRSLLRELPAHDVPRDFVFATAPAGVTSVPALNVNHPRGWTFRPPGWAYAGAASVVGLAVAVFVLSSDVSLWLPGDSQKISQPEVAEEVSEREASLPEQVASMPESLASMPPLPVPAPAAPAAAESEVESDVPFPQAAAEESLATGAQPELRDIEPTPAPVAAFLAPEAYEEPLQDVGASPGLIQAESEPAPTSVPAAASMAKESLTVPPSAAIEDSEQDATIEAPPPAPVQPMLAMAAAPSQEKAVPTAPPSIEVQLGDAAAGQESPAVSPVATSVPDYLESPQSEASAEVSASDQPAVAARSNSDMVEAQQTAESPKPESSEVNPAVTESARGDPALQATLAPAPQAVASASPEIETVDPKTAFGVAPDPPASVPDQEMLQTAPAILDPPEPVATAKGEGSPAPAGLEGHSQDRGAAGPSGVDDGEPVRSRGGPEIGLEEGRITGATEPQGSQGMDHPQALQPSASKGDSAIPGFGIRSEILLAIAGTAAALVVLLALFGLYRLWVGRQGGGKSGTNGAIDPSLMVNRPKLGNGGG